MKIVSKLHFLRPDLVNWREVRSRLDTRQRLERVFNLAEREFGVTRLLDPEGRSEVFLFFLRGKVYFYFYFC